MSGTVLMDGWGAVGGEGEVIRGKSVWNTVEE